VKKQRVIDLTKAGHTIFGRGIERGNPQKCLRCMARIGRGDAWRVDWSATDPEYGRYAIIRHLGKCPGAIAPMLRPNGNSRKEQSR